jgi:hypothetical protein
MSPISSTLANASAYGYRTFVGETNSYESIASATGTGSSATITFSSIPSTYASLQIRINGRSDAAVDTTYIQVQYNATAMTKGHYLRGDGSTATAGAVNVPIYIPGGNTTSTIMGVGIVDIQDYASTTLNKTGRSIGGWNGNNAYTTQERLQLGSFFLDSTSAISALSFVLGNGNWTTNSTVALYGIKG